jgi:hypothetical protein
MAGILPDIDEIKHAEDDVSYSNHENKGPFAIEGERAEKPILAVRALDEPSPADYTPALWTIEYLSLFSMLPQFNIFLEFAVHVQPFSAATTPDFSWLEIIPDSLLSAHRTFNYKHVAAIPFLEYIFS